MAIDFVKNRLAKGIFPGFSLKKALSCGFGLVPLNEKFTCIDSIKLKEVEVAASQLTGYNPGLFQTQKSQLCTTMETTQPSKVKSDKKREFGFGS